jgi:uncharacterized membrane protein
MKPDTEEQPGQSKNVQQQPGADRTGENVAPGIAALIGMLVIGLIYAALPQNVIIGPNWLLLVIEAVFLAPLLFIILTERELSHAAKHTLVLIPLGIITVALVIGVVLLIVTLPSNQHAINLLRSAALLWCFNILVFSLWYWELDGGGPWKRHLSGHLAADFMFPQQANGNSWAPHYMDYLFLAFTSATALSPADTVPLSRAAKALMMMEAILSLAIIAVIAARAINIL